MTNTTFDSANYLQQYYEQLHDSLDQGVIQLRAIFNYLRVSCPQLLKIEITYNGCGDSGQVEDIRYNPLGSGGEPVQIDDSQPLPDELAMGRKSQSGHWDTERREWIAKHPDLNESIAEALDRIGWDIAYGKNPGFEINEGAFGTLSIGIDPGSGASEPEIQLEHSERIESTNDYSYTF